MDVGLCDALCLEGGMKMFGCDFGNLNLSIHIFSFSVLLTIHVDGPYFLPSSRHTCLNLARL
jgi:hypothetical protein